MYPTSSSGAGAVDIGAIGVKVGGGVVLDHAEGMLQRLGRNLGSGLFCQIIDRGDRRNLGLDLRIELDAPQRAIGLERAEFCERTIPGALGTGLVSAETIRGGSAGRIAEILGSARGEFGFDATEAGKIPGGVEEV